MAAEQDTGAAAAIPACVGDFTVPYGDIGDPLLRRELLPRYRAAGVHFVSLSVSGDGPDAGIVPTLSRIAGIRCQIQAEPDVYAMVRSVDDIFAARGQGRLAVMFNFQGIGALGDDAGLIESYYQLGVRHMLLAYNHASAAADGCLEERNGGLTAFGRRLITAMNRVGMIVDCAHTGRRATREIMDASTQPVIISHTNAAAIHEHPRGVTDEQIRACAAQGGVVGITGISAMMNARKDGSVAAYVEHIDHCVQLVGADHVGISLDYVYDNAATFRYFVALSGGALPKGLNFTVDMPMVEPERFPQIADALAQRGYPQPAVDKILGLNWLRVARTVWR